jgi:hypothetical protein
MRRSMPILTLSVCVAATLFAAPASAQVSASGSAGADAVRSWNEIAVTTLVAGAVPIPEQPLNLAYVHRAVYTAVTLTAILPGRDATPAAVATAAHDVLVANYPAQQAVIDQDYATALAGLPDTWRRRVAVAIGRWAARRLLDQRADDGRNGPTVPVPPPGPGAWVPTPPNTIGLSSWVSKVRPFELTSPSQFRPPPPPSLTSTTWATDYNETRLYGSATSIVRTAAQTEVARFWADPPFVQNQRALRAYTEARDLSAVQTARVFALADSAAADAMIACWDAKYTYNFWRPFSAIPAGDTDSNPATPADPMWTPLLPTPNHPEYPSAHGCGTTAFVTVLAGLERNHALDLTMTSTTTGTTHHFTSIGQLTDELANARVWAGLHWRFSTTAGVRLGASVGHVVLAHSRSWLA